MLEHALLQMFWKIVWDDEGAFDDALSSSMGSFDPDQYSSGTKRILLTCIAMTMRIVLCLLHGIDLISYSLDVLGFVGWDLLDSLILPMNVFPVGHCGLIFSFV